MSEVTSFTVASISHLWFVSMITELGSCVKVEVVVLDFQSLISHIVSVEVKQKLNFMVEECLKPVPGACLQASSRPTFPRVH